MDISLLENNLEEEKMWGKKQEQTPASSILEFTSNRVNIIIAL